MFSILFVDYLILFHVFHVNIHFLVLILKHYYDKYLQNNDYYSQYFSYLFLFDDMNLVILSLILLIHFHILIYKFLFVYLNIFFQLL